MTNEVEIWVRRIDIGGRKHTFKFSVDGEDSRILRLIKNDGTLSLPYRRQELIEAGYKKEN